MITKRTGIGLAVGGAIIVIGVLALIGEITQETLDVNETFAIGEATNYQITGSKGAHHIMKITGDKFDLELKSPGDLQINKTSFEGEKTLDWFHTEDGQTRINLQNTGNSELVVNATLEIATDPILFAYHFIVITSGVVIIGFSMGFSLRKPKGF